MIDNINATTNTNSSNSNNISHSNCSSNSNNDSNRSSNNHNHTKDNEVGPYPNRGSCVFVQTSVMRKGTRGHTERPQAQ